jgi:N-acetylmuramoyl-L-alanine amidase
VKRWWYLGLLLFFQTVWADAVVRSRPFIVAIDAGHGGEDPGAVGAKGTREKDVVLQMAKKLSYLINQKPGMKAVLVREDDSYVHLRKRMHHARAHNADLFISIHADSYHDSTAYGASVFVLSKRGASSEAARWLAKKENEADLIGGISLTDKDSMLASVLLDLSQSASSSASLELGEAVLQELHKIVPLHKKKVESAGFMVLKSPDIPSILVETGFISHKTGETNLRKEDYQWKIAHAILKGVQRYADRRVPTVITATPPPTTPRKSFSYVVRSGDTLFSVAQKHRLSVDTLKHHNRLKDNALQIGQVLTIPTP